MEESPCRRQSDLRSGSAEAKPYRCWEPLDYLLLLEVRRRQVGWRIPRNKLAPLCLITRSFSARRTSPMSASGLSTFLTTKTPALSRPISNSPEAAAAEAAAREAAAEAAAREAAAEAAAEAAVEAVVAEAAVAADAAAAAAAVAAAAAAAAAAAGAAAAGTGDLASPAERCLSAFLRGRSCRRIDRLASGL
jgi:pyruvate/2-oxoglutarate dehydrogenase complex dihydrolipoamide acyltransferase (E2) component